MAPKKELDPEILMRWKLLMLLVLDEPAVAFGTCALDSQGASESVFAAFDSTLWHRVVVPALQTARVKVRDVTDGPGHGPWCSVGCGCPKQGAEG